MTPPRFILDKSAHNPDADMWFAQPAGFTTIPFRALLNPADSPAAKALRQALAPILDSLNDELARQQFLAHLAQGQRLLAILAEAGTTRCAIGLHRDDVSGTAKGSLLFSLFTVSWRDISPAAPAATAARAVAGAEGHTNIAYLELPCGPASFSETVRTPTADSGLPQDPVLQVFAHLPHPDGRRLVVLTLGTTAVNRRTEYRSLLHQIAENVSFEDPLLELAALTKAGGRSRPPRG
ncbi:hypothetical protein GKQ77_28185 [Streptomyces sp. BG9H]|uniref:Uncharacterized protein n=1 Tax=Streptomyces anatolicus TaxID=2675858 RepID=A0ABS6YWS3_9ACTN|nr:hypothetical protein [Streptomyces anatolicus]MBW5425394.1 hypothetical protein [Streptomyces anatolicus]